MKHITTITLFTLHLSIFTLSASSAVPLRWTVDTSSAQPATFEAYQGETLAFEAALQSRGKPLELSGIAALYWQTNGMGSVYWEASAAVNSNRLSAVFTPEMDVGAKVYNCFIGVPGTIYHAAFQLRLRPSPGATPNVLPLPVPVIDFAKVRVLNPPWSGGGGGGVDTNAVIDIVREQLETNGIRSVDGAARPLPKYLHELSFDSSYPDEAQEYYRSRGDGKVSGGCSAVRNGSFLYRNFDYPFDDRAEFVVKMSAGPNRFASVGVAQVGTNLTEAIVTSGKPSRWYKALPGATVDGINENGVACNINVVDGDPQWGGGVSPALHPLAAVRWILDNATNAQHAATYIASHIAFQSGWTQNFHYMVCDATSTYIVEDGESHLVGGDVLGAPPSVITNFRRFPTRDTTGEGQERYDALAAGENITNAWYTNAYRRETNPPWLSDLQGLDTNLLFSTWAAKPKESHRGETFGMMTWWQTVHTSVYDITNRTLRVAVQETPDWYTFAVDQANVDLAPIEAQIAALQVGKRDKDDRAVYLTGPDFDTSVLPPGSVLVAAVMTDTEKWFFFSKNSSGLITGNSDLGYDSFDELMSVRQDIGFHTFYQGSAVTLRFAGTKQWEKPNQQLAAVATDNAAKPANGDLVKYDAANERLVKAEKSSTSSDPANADYRDPQDNVCHKTEFGEWTLTYSDGVDHGKDASLIEFTESSPRHWVYGSYGFSGDIMNENATELVMYANSDWMEPYTMTATRSAVCTSNELFVTRSFVTNAVNASKYVPSATNPTFSNAVLAVEFNFATNEVESATYVAATNVLAQLGFDEDAMENLPGGKVYGSLGALLAALAAAVALLRKKTKLLKSDGTAEDDFATDLLGKPVAKTALMIPLEAKVDSFVAEDGHAYAVTMTGTVTITMPTTTTGKAAIFQARFSAAAQHSVQFDTDDVVKFDGADCGIVKAGKDALLSAMWNGEAWDLVWKNQA